MPKNIYIQFKSEKEVSEFSKLLDPSLEEELLQKFRDAEAKDLICVFQLKDTPDAREVVNAWRNR